MNYLWAAATHTGRIRNNNEDAFAPEASGRGPGPVVLMVADGMGGAVGGEVASRLAVETAVGTDGTPADRVVAANRRVVKEAFGDPHLAGMGTTMTLVQLDPGGHAHFAHVGDSRAYLLSDSQFQMLTVDHTVVAEHVAAGRLSQEDALTHPQRSMLTRVLGINPELEVDEIDVDLQPGDRILMCSDGLTNMVPDDRIASIMGSLTPEEAVWTLIEEANRAGGHDNITVVVVDVVP
ncbi:MAG TPA: PP2C family serine/threonine-protein phosphatase [Acidimicrobiia bacterium]|nr:PP2C family serine/threonine-protein phosphatase [Acidimicrobiia bacterium]